MKFFESIFPKSASNENERDPFKPDLMTPPDVHDVIHEPTHIVEGGVGKINRAVEIDKRIEFLTNKGTFTPEEVIEIQELEEGLNKIKYIS